MPRVWGFGAEPKGTCTQVHGVIGSTARGLLGPGSS